MATITGVGEMSIKHIAVGVFLSGLAVAGWTAELWIGAAEADITPDRPVALDGNTTGPI